MFAAVLVAGLFAAEPPKPAVESKLHGEWKGGACMGQITFKADGTYERKNWSPGNNALAGTWSVRWDALPPTLVMTCKTSDFQGYVGKTEEVTLLRLDADVLVYQYPDFPNGPSRYERVMKNGKADEKKAFDLRDADGNVLVAADEITAYDWATHTLTVKPDAAARLKKFLREEKKLDTPFSAAIGGKSVYEGQLTTVLSSRSLRGVVIVVDLPQDGKEDVVRLQLGYPGYAFFKGKDPRGDDTVKAALKATGKLK